MGQRALRIIAAIGIVAALTVGGAGAASATESDRLACGTVGSEASISCTVVGPDGADATLVLAVADPDGAEEALSTTKRIVGTEAHFTTQLPDGAARVVALALVNGVEVGTAAVALKAVAAVDPTLLGAPNVTLAGSAFGLLAVGAVVVYVSARRRGIENRRIQAYGGLQT